MFSLYVFNFKRCAVRTIIIVSNYKSVATGQCRLAYAQRSLHDYCLETKS